VRLTLLDFVTQTWSRYLKESCKDIDTVRNINIVARSDLLRYLGCTEMYEVLENSTSSRFTS
jgi:hypothetical protein